DAEGGSCATYSRNATPTRGGNADRSMDDEVDGHFAARPRCGSGSPASSARRDSRYPALGEGRQYTHARSHRSVSEIRTAAGGMRAAAGISTTGSRRPGVRISDGRKAFAVGRDTLDVVTG